MPRILVSEQEAELARLCDDAERLGAPGSGAGEQHLTRRPLRARGDNAATLAVADRGPTATVAVVPSVAAAAGVTHRFQEALCEDGIECPLYGL